MVPPNNQGRVTPFYNRGDDGDKPARPGVENSSEFDGYTRNAVTTLPGNYVVFAGQRDDGFYGDIQSIFDLDFTFNKPAPFDSQGGFNVHTIVLNIPLSELGGAKIAGVYATTTRRIGDERMQVGRQGNPLFAEALVAIRDKDRYNQTMPQGDDANFGRYADNPELSKALGVTPIIPGLIRSIFIPDLIKVDLTTPPARLAGANGFHRLGFFGGDKLKSTFQDPFGNGGFIPGGWPNGRRFGDDVIDIAFIALGAAGPGPDFSMVNADKVKDNDITYNRVFPYAATPLNGRVHGHHGQDEPKEGWPRGEWPSLLKHCADQDPLTERPHDLASIPSCRPRRACLRRRACRTGPAARRRHCPHDRSRRPVAPRCGPARGEGRPLPRSEGSRWRVARCSPGHRTGAYVVRSSPLW